MLEEREANEEHNDAKLDQDFKERGLRHKLVKAKALDGDIRYDGKLVSGRSRLALLIKYGKNPDDYTRVQKFNNYREYLKETARESLETKNFRQRKLLWHELVNALYVETKNEFETQKDREEYISAEFLISVRSVQRLLDPCNKHIYNIRQGGEYSEPSDDLMQGEADLSADNKVMSRSLSNSFHQDFTQEEHDKLPTMVDKFKNQVVYICPHCGKDINSGELKRKDNK
jgi:hypothetical protein